MSMRLSRLSVALVFACCSAAAGPVVTSSVVGDVSVDGLPGEWKIAADRRELAPGDVFDPFLGRESVCLVKNMPDHPVVERRKVSFADRGVYIHLFLEAVVVHGVVEIADGIGREISESGGPVHIL